MKNELYFLFHCQVYKDLRIQVIYNIQTREHGFNAMPDLEKLKFVLRYDKKECAKLIVNAMARRK